VALIVAAFLYVELTERTPVINLTTIDFSNTYSTVSAIYQRKTFYDNGTCWLFYCNGTALMYTTSSDGVSWRPSVLVSSLPSASAMSIWHEDGEVHYALASGVSGDPAICRKGKIVGNEIAWEEPQIAIQAGAGYEYYNGYCTIDGEGHPWVSCLSSYGEQWTVKVSEGNSEGDLWNPPEELYDPSPFPQRTSILPLAGARIYALSVDEMKVEGRLWNGTAWEHVETITNQPPSQDFGYSAVSLNGEVHFVLLQNQTNDVLHYKRYTNGTWETTVIASAQGILSFPVLSADPLKNVLYCAWIKDNTIQLEKRENESWQKISIPNLALTSPRALSCFYTVTDGKLGLAILEWVEQKQLFQLRYYVIKDI